MTNNERRQEEGDEEEEVKETCPICCNDLDSSDRMYKLECPTSSCQFGFCSDCLRGMVAASLDDYDVASDGSNQVKVKLVCPQCRSPYKCVSFSSEIIVDAVLLLRRARSVQRTLTLTDDLLSASSLAARAEFCQTIAVEHIQIALERMKTYHVEIGKLTPVPPLDMALLRKHLRGDPSTSSSPGYLSHQQLRARNWKDPTLFLGLESVLTADEQEFLTKLLVSGQPELLVQASFILHQMIHHPTTAKTTVRELANFGGGNSRGNSGSRTMVPYDSNKMSRLRQRYPLPRMPVCLPLPISLVSKIQMRDDLVLRSTRGGAGVGRFGVRQGDVVTHVGDFPVSNREELERALTSAAAASQHDRDKDTVTLTVNASQTTARALQERAFQMQEDNVRFL
jgi:hypothetical protein